LLIIRFSGSLSRDPFRRSRRPLFLWSGHHSYLLSLSLVIDAFSFVFRCSFASRDPSFVFPGFCLLSAGQFYMRSFFKPPLQRSSL